MTLFDDDVSVDSEARRAIRDDLHRNLFVEAGAGTGKTTVLVARVVNIVATGTISEPSELVAITYTEAAAAELRDRIRTELDAAARDIARADDQRARCAEARRRIDEAVITTLHGFAQRILAEHPLEAGLPPRFEIDDGVLAEVRFLERWSAFLDDLYDDRDMAQVLLQANALGLTSAHLLDVARRFHERWDRVVDADLTPRGARPVIDLVPIRDAVAAALAVAGDRVFDPGDRLATHLFYDWATFDQLLRQAVDDGDELEVLRTLGSVPKVSKNGTKAFWGDDKAIVVEHLRVAHDAAHALVDALRTDAIERLLPRLQALTAAGVEERRRAGTLEFHDLLVFARDLLRGHAHIRAALAQRFGVLLVDEFQDTDPIQLDIVFMLAAADPAAPPPPWREAELAPGKLLIVGDPKQSIYGFRGADIRVWDDAKDHFGTSVEHLHQSFRTVPQVIEWVNGVFATVIGDGRHGSQPAYSHLAPTRDELHRGPAVILLGGEADAPMDELRGAEADDIARLVSQAKHEGWTIHDPSQPSGSRSLRYDDVALLLPTRASLSHLERALDGHGVPYRVESRSLVWSTDAVRELVAVLTAIDDPGDDIAVVTALRSPGFACSDVELVEWRSAGGRWDHRRERPDDVPAEHPVARAMTALRSYHEVRNVEPVDRLVERVIRERRLIELTFAQRRPRDHWRRLRFVLDQSRAFVEAGGASLGDLVRWADLQTAEGATVVETPAPEADDDAVRILTVHGSKGLEFPMVVLAGLGTQLRTASSLVAWGRDRPEVAVGAKDRRFATSGWASAAAGADDAALDEATRLLYVAATRVRDHLVIGMRHKPSGASHGKALATAMAANDALARLARTVDLGDQLTLPVGDGLLQQPPAIDHAARAAWLAAHDQLLAAAGEARVLSATAIAKLGRALADDDDDVGSDGDDDLVVASPVADHLPTPSPGAMRRGGTARGRAVHAVLQSVDLDHLDDPAGLEALAALEAAAEGIGSSAPEVAALARSILGSATLRAARASTRRWREVTVTVPVGDRLVEGYVDLLFEDAAGRLVVVDHKTDRADGDDELDAAVERYRLQLAAYALAIEAATGRTVDRAVLVFARAHGPAVEREVADLPAAVNEARALAAT